MISCIQTLVRLSGVRHLTLGSTRGSIQEIIVQCPHSRSEHHLVIRTCDMSYPWIGGTQSTLYIIQYTYTYAFVGTLRWGIFLRHFLALRPIGLSILLLHEVLWMHQVRSGVSLNLSTQKILTRALRERVKCAQHPSVVKVYGMAPQAPVWVCGSTSFHQRSPGVLPCKNLQNFNALRAHLWCSRT